MRAVAAGEPPFGRPARRSHYPDLDVDLAERFTEWRSTGLTISDTTLQSLVDGPDGLTVVLESDSRLLTVSFGLVVAFRSVLEEACGEFWSRFHAAGRRTGVCWVVEDSSWLESFSSADLCLYPGVRHYLFVTDDERIDVLAQREPEVSCESQPSR